MKTEIPYELTNEQRRSLGLVPVMDTWDLVFFEGMYLYYDKDVIRKKISIGENSYHETELCECTAENRTILLPKTKRGKPKKMNYTASLSFSPLGVYFSFDKEWVHIANYTTQTTFFHEQHLGKVKLEEWINHWVNDTTQKDFEDIEAFKNSKRQHTKFKEGDFFAYKIGRREWGFGRILLDISARREELKKGKNYGLTNLPSKPLLIMIYRTCADSPHIDISELLSCGTLPTQAISDNNFHYGEYKIIGHKPLSPEEWEPVISYGRSINGQDRDTVYLQYGLIFKETTVDKFDKYLINQFDRNPYRMESIGFGINGYGRIKELIEKGCITPTFDSKDIHNPDLRSPENRNIKREIFSFFGLDADKSYAENLK